MYALLGKRKVIKKSRSNWPIPVRACHLNQKKYPSQSTYRNEPTLLAPTAAGRRGSTQSPEIGLTLVRLIYDTIMLTSATDLVH
jgi:hypothetical protein